MSFLKARLGPRARDDLREILFYTGQRWGTRQRSIYRAQLLDALRQLGRNPERGMARDDLFPGCRSLLVESHRIYCRITRTEIVVSRVLHVSQDDAGAVILPEP